MRFTNQHLFKLSAIVVALLAVTFFVGNLASTATAKSAAEPMFACVDCNVCFPSCPTNDARMMSLSGGGLASFVGGTLEVGFTTPAAQPSITIGVFDADSIGPLAGGLWDQSTVDLKFEVFADPSGTGTPTTKLDEFLSTDIGAVDNDWWDHIYADGVTPNFADALTPAGNYSFVFRISVDGTPDPGTINGFKLRTNRNISLRGQSIQFIAKASFASERAIIYPGLPAGQCPAANQPTTYDGSWEFSFTVPVGTTRLELWDGEMDFGSLDGATVDTDDPNTPPTGVCIATGGTAAQCAGNPDVPLWAQGTASVAEGAKGMGDPPDDNGMDFPQCLVTRPPSVNYRLIPPSGPVNAFVNNNPSGSAEWEKFLISSDAVDIDADYKPAVIEPGVWRLRLEGVDIFNQFTLHFMLTVLPEVCKQTIGDLVWEDLNGNGVKDAGEPGIQGVAVNLLASAACDNNYIAAGNTVTDPLGAYSFTDLAKGCYRVQVATPAGFTKTTGPNPGQNNNSQANPYDINLNADACTNNLTADFGFMRPITCPICTQPEIVVDTEINLDANNLAATAGVLAPFASFAGNTITIDLGNRPLHVTSKGSISVLAGANVQPPQFHQSGNHGTPNLTIKSTCTLLIDESVRGTANGLFRSLTGVIETNAQGGKAGDILLAFDGAIIVNGGVQSFQEKLPDSASSLSGAITIKSVCGEIRVGPKGWVVTWGENPGTSPISLIQLGTNDIVVNGLVMNRTNHTIGSNPPPIINVHAVGGAVKIDGSQLVLDEFNLMGTKYDLTSGLLTISRVSADVGKINIQAFKDVSVVRNVMVGSLNRTSFAAVATVVNSNSPIGGTIRVRSLNGGIIAQGRAFQADGRGNNSAALIELIANGLVQMQTPASFNPEQTPTVTTSAGAVNGVGKAGKNVLYSCTGQVQVLAGAAVLATGVSGTGINQSSAGVVVVGTVDPAFVGGVIACPPTPLF